MNGTTLRIAGAAACVAALALPAGAAAKARHHRPAHKTQTTTIVVPHDYDAGGNGAPLGVPAGTKINLFNPLDFAQSLGNNLLGQLGLPPLPLP